MSKARRETNSFRCSVFWNGHANSPEPLQLRHRRQRAGAANLDLDLLEQRGRLRGRKLVRDRPARRPRDESQSLLPVEPVDLVDDTVDVVVELGPDEPDLVMKCQQL